VGKQAQEEVTSQKLLKIKTPLYSCPRFTEHAVFTKPSAMILFKSFSSWPNAYPPNSSGILSLALYGPAASSPATPIHTPWLSATGFSPHYLL
jgi:hypothetical protein